MKKIVLLSISFIFFFYYPSFSQNTTEEKQLPEEQVEVVRPLLELIELDTPLVVDTPQLIPNEVVPIEEAPKVPSVEPIKKEIKPIKPR